MASELSVTTRLRFRKGLVDSGDQGVSNLSVDVSGTHDYKNTQDIGTTHEQITFPADLVTVGYCQMRNLDSTNYIEVGLVVSATFYPFAKIKAGKTALVPLATNTIYAKANTAAAKLLIYAVED